MILPSSLVATPLAAQVERVGPARIAAEPGAAVTVAFRVRNPSASPAPAAATLPRGWPLVSPDADAPVPGGASMVRLVGMVVPRGAAAGAYLVRYRAGGFADSAVIAVAARRGIDVAVEETPRFTVAGSPYTVAFRVTNRGNGRAAVRLSVESALGFAARADARALDLAAGGSAVVRVTVATKAAHGAAAHRVTLRAAAEGAAGSAAARVPLVRRGARGEDARTLPVTVALRAGSGTDARGGVPGVVTASGALAAGTRVDVFWRGRGAAAPELGEQEQLSISLRGARGELRLGDQFWSLSPLVAPGRAGYGAGGRVSAGPLWAEGFSARNRFVAGAPRVTAGSLGIGGAPGSITANYAVPGDGTVPATSLRARITPLAGFGAEAEYGAAAGTRGGQARLFAGRQGWGLDARAIEADAGFPGEQRGRSLLQAHGRASLAGGLRVDAGFERERRADTLGRVIAGTRLGSSSAYATVSLGNVATLQRRIQTRDGIGAAGSFARRSDAWLATASFRVGRTSFGGGMEMGTVVDELADASSPFRRAWLRVGTSARIGSAWAAVERRTGASVETGGEMDRVLGSLGVQLQPAADTRLSLMAQAGAAEWTDARDGVVDGTVEQRLPGGHTLRLRVRAFPWAEPGRRRPLVYLDYAIPLRLPVGRAGGTGTVSGRVVDQETGAPIADALVRVGDRAVATDGRGRWAIAGLAPGGYTVEIDPVSVGVGRVAVRPDALKVDVAGGRERAVEVGVSRAARIEGRIAVADPEAGDGGVGGAVVELRRGSDRRRRVTDAGGRFLFTDLAPGEWTVAVVSADLPPNHALERDAAAVTLEAGATAAVELRAVPRRREMVIVSGGELVLGGAPVRGAAPPAVHPAPAVAGILTSPSRPAKPIEIAAPSAPVAMRPSSPSVTSAAPAERPELAASARPWRERGASGFSDWPNDTYVVREGDESLVAVAWLVYRDGSLWPKIWLANRTVLDAPDRLPVGVELLIPPLAPLTAEERDAARAWPNARRAQSRSR
ncbi:MAG TPA: carboxypeptidase regulatory-like domain-containing protein [Longimicrobium sp.]